MRTIAMTILALALIGCAEGATQAQTVAEFERAGIVAIAHKNWGRLYATMHPAQKKLVTYRQFVDCANANAAISTAFGVDFSSLRFISARVLRQKSVTIPGTNIRANATVVRVRTSLVERGKRSRDSDLSHDVKVNGRWRWVDTYIKPSEYKDRSCGNGG